METRRKLLVVGVALVVAHGACDDDESINAPSPSAKTAASTGGQGGGTTPSTGGSGGIMQGACAANFCADAAPLQPCLGCMSRQCAAELADCNDDTSSGGAGGSSCLACGEVVDDPAASAGLCAASQALFGALHLCLCGDAAAPGKCN